jgi:hypothetical protein
MTDFNSKYNGDQIEQRLNKIKDMVGATASSMGEAGLAPAPAKGDEGKFLRGDGTWQDAGVHDPGFLTDNFNDENDFRGILLTLATGGGSSVTQQQYDLIASKCKIDAQTQYLLSGISSMYGIGDVILSKSSSGDIQAIFRTGGFSDIAHIDYAMTINISNDLTVTSSVSGSLIQMVGSSAKDIELSIGSQDKETGIRFYTSGSGTKALMDNGTYKSISNEVDITDVLIDSENQYKKTITSNDFNNLKQYVLDRKDLYIDFHVVYDGSIITSSKQRFISQVINGDYILLTCIAIDSGGGFSPIVDFYEIDGSNLTIKISNYNLV